MTSRRAIFRLRRHDSVLNNIVEISLSLNVMNENPTKQPTKNLTLLASSLKICFVAKWELETLAYRVPVPVRRQDPCGASMF